MERLIAAIVIGWTVLCVPLFVYCALQRPGWPYFLAAFLAAPPSCFLAALLFLEIVHPSDIEGLMMYPIACVGAVVGSYATVAVVAAAHRLTRRS